MVSREYLQKASFSLSEKKLSTVLQLLREQTDYTQNIEFKMRDNDSKL